MLKELTLAEFKEKFPQVSIYGLEDPLNVFLENGEILIEREWNGEEYILKNGKTYRPVYKPLNEDDYTVIKLDIDQSALIDEVGEALIVLIYDSELYQIFNGNEKWSIHIMVNDMETQKEMMNIQFPKEKFRLSPDMWEKVKTNE